MRRAHLGVAIGFVTGCFTCFAAAQPSGGDAGGGSVLLDEQYRDWRARCVAIAASGVAGGAPNCYVLPNPPTPGIAVLIAPRNNSFDVAVISPRDAESLTAAEIQIDRGAAVRAEPCEGSLCAFRGDRIPDLEHALRHGRSASLRVSRAEGSTIEVQLSLSGIAAALDRVAAMRQGKAP